MSERVVRSTRRDVLKLAGAAAIGAVGVSALTARPVKAAGSPTAIVPYFNPFRVASGHLAANSEVVIGPFPSLGGFDSQVYFGMIGNLTAKNWHGAGWLSARSTDDAFDPVNQCLNLHFAGHFPAWSNSFLVKFGFTGTAPGMASTGQFILRSGPAPTDYIVDAMGFLLDDLP